MNDLQAQETLKANGHDPCIYPVGDYRVFRLDPDDAYSSKFVYRFVIRCLEFVERYGSEITQPTLVNKIYELFTPQWSRAICLLVAVDHNETIVAHLLAYVDAAGKLGTVIQLHQVENDTAKADIPIAFMRLANEWRESIGIKTTLTMALSESRVEIARRYGFEHYRTVLIRKDD